MLTACRCFDSRAQVLAALSISISRWLRGFLDVPLETGGDAVPALVMARQGPRWLTRIDRQHQRTERGLPIDEQIVGRSKPRTITAIILSRSEPATSIVAIKAR